MPSANYLTLHTSNRLEILAAELARIFSEPLVSPLVPEIVIMQSHGMERWLSQQLAQRLGVCANINFSFPQRFIDGLIEELLPSTTDTRLYERDAMTWRIIALLPTLETCPEFAPIARYLRHRDRDLRAWQLAQRIAQAFDQYLVFRPRMILHWDAGKEDHWQAILWRELQTPAPRQHTPALAQELVATFPRVRKKLPERVTIFGVSTLPPLYIEMFEQLAAFVPVHLFVMQPTPTWWGDVQSKRERHQGAQLDLFESAMAEDQRANPLLEENARLGRDFLNVLFESGTMRHLENFEKPSGEKLLARIQDDIFEFEKPRRNKRVSIRASDCSLQFHSCYSVTRELEVLQSQLFALFDRDASLLPKDIVVMMPDVSIYAPFIDAVFKVHETNEQRIPYAIADRTGRAASGMIDSFLRVIELLPGRFRASEVLGLLESPPVQQKFGLTASDLEKIRRWTKEAGARWGIDASHRAALNLPAFADNSWRHALDRMLLGYAMQPEEDELFAGILPFAQIEGSDADLLGQFTDFLERLFTRARDFATPRSLSHWQRDLLNALDEFLQSDDTTERESTQLRTSISRLQDIEEITRNSAPVPLQIVAQQLERSIDDSRRGAGFLTGALTFCALKPMRSVPFRVVCLLGMNDTAYPRGDRAPGFDLIAQNPKPGDRTTRADDRALFLEALLSARDVFYISYLGRSLRDNSPLPPSVLVSELIDYVQTLFALPLKSAVAEHPLQAFSARNFDGRDARVFSYSAENGRAAAIAATDRTEMAPWCGEPLPEPDESRREITLAQLEDFFANPAKFFLREQLLIQLPRDEPSLEDDECFSLVPLDAYQLDQALLQKTLRGRDPGDAFDGVRAQGILPPAEVGRRLFADAAANARIFGEAIRGQLAAPIDPALEVQETIGPFTFTARIDEVRGGVLLRFRLTRLKPKDFVRAWLRHLGRNLVEKGETRLFGFEKAVTAFRFAALDKKTAGSFLEDLLEIYWRGVSAPLRFFPESSWAFANALAESKAASEARTASDKGWFGNKQTDRGGDRNDRFIAQVFRGEEDARTPEWEKISKQILGPLLERLEKYEAV